MERKIQMIPLSVTLTCGFTKCLEAASYVYWTAHPVMFIGSSAILAPVVLCKEHKNLLEKGGKEDDFGIL